MKNNDSEILKWAIDKIESEYRDDVALLVGHGADMQDLDGRVGRFKGEIDYYVPITERANKLFRTFIVDDVCYDIYPRTWESIEAMAALNDCHTACLADATVLYARSDAEREHFERIRAKLFQNLQSREVALSKARERLNVAREIFLGMIFDRKLYEVRTSTGFILDYLGQSIALFNGRYFRRNALYQLEELESFPRKPEQFALVYTCFDQSFNYYAIDQIGLSTGYNGAIKGVMGIVTLIANGTVCVWLLQKTDTRKSVVAVLAICSLTMACALMLTSLVPFLIVNVLFYALSVISVPLLQNLVAAEGKAKRYDNNMVMGFYNAMRSLGGILGALLAGFTYMVTPKTPFICCVIGFLLAALFSGFYALRSTKKA